MRGGGVVWDMSSTCVQGGLPRPLGGYQPNLIMEPHSPAPAWQLHHPLLPKQEPMEEDRNDSGINSGSDFHSSSPGSENSQEYNPTASYSSSQNPQSSTYYSTSLISRVSPSPMGYHANIPIHLRRQSGIPSEANCIQVPQQLVKSTNSFVSNERSNTPPPENLQTDNTDIEDPLRRLQFTLEKNGLIPPPILSPKTSEHSADDDNKSDVDSEEFDEHALRTPKMNSHGKVKTHKCKQCEFVAITKLDFWMHSKVHINPDKLLTCPKCPFVTEYKHHLEYHLRNHFGSKPFRCDKCSYTCVNKSMLNSHMKSHSNIYQYRCADCSYATKYCHSLKLHLRKYAHKPAMVLHPDGTPNPLPIIDVYGTRRGPKQRPTSKCEEAVNPANVLQSQFTHLMMNASPQMQLPFPYHFLAGFQNHLSNPLLLSPVLENLVQQRERSPGHQPEQEQLHLPKSPISASAPDHQPSEALDLSKPDVHFPEQPPKSRRKGRAFKLENLPVNDSSEDEDHTASGFNAEKRTDPPTQKSPENKIGEEVTNNNNNNNASSTFGCTFCNISFGDIILYTMHMGYHGFKDPFTCNMCGEQCKDKVSFFLHIARNPHT